MDPGTEKVSNLLHEAGETHPQVYRIVDGEDSDWASWYADWLINLSELPELLGARPVRSDHLVRLDKEFVAQERDDKWEDFYARELIQRLASP